MWHRRPDNIGISTKVKWDYVTFPFSKYWRLGTLTLAKIWDSIFQLLKPWLFTRQTCWITFCLVQWTNGPRQWFAPLSHGALMWSAIKCFIFVLRKERLKYFPWFQSSLCCLHCALAFQPGSSKRKFERKMRKVIMVCSMTLKICIKTESEEIIRQSKASCQNVRFFSLSPHQMKYK